MDKSYIKHKIKHDLQRLITLGKWVLFSIIMGIISGLVGSIFYNLVFAVTGLREDYPQFLLLLPVGSVLIAYMYKVFKDDNDGGTNLVLSAIHSNENIPFRMSFLIFLSTIFSHLCGASVGREGAALQIGGSVGQGLGKILKLDRNDKNTMVMCGMSGVFSALFGTPVAAAFFSMEVVSVGIMHYAALVPCVISSVIARFVAEYFGAKAPSYDIIVAQFSIKNMILVAILAGLAGLCSVLFCIILHKTEEYLKKFFSNIYIRALCGGTVLFILTVLAHSQRYNGAGIDLIKSAVEGDVQGWDFILKILFTAVSIAAAYKGGEIVPSFVIGATFGSFFGQLFGLPASLSAAIGMGAVFCGVTNTPVTSLLICFEMFGLKGWPYFLIAIAISYEVSGYYSVYQSQRIVYSKYKSNYINKQAH